MSEDKNQIQKSMYIPRFLSSSLYGSSIRVRILEYFTRIMRTRLPVPARIASFNSFFVHVMLVASKSHAVEDNRSHLT